MGNRSMRTIVIANQKGGVAKTTTAVNLASEMSRNSRRVLLVDFDPQRSSTSSIFGNVEFELSTYDLLFENVAADEIIQTSPDFGVDVIPSDIMLSSAELKLASIIGREKTLAVMAHRPGVPDESRSRGRRASCAAFRAPPGRHPPGRG